MRFNGDLFTCQCENEDKKVKGLQILHFYWSFSSDIMAVKGLSTMFTGHRVGDETDVQKKQAKPAPVPPW